MKRDLDIVITNLDGDPIKLVKGNEEVRIIPDSEEQDESDHLTIGRAISQALIMGKPDGALAKENITRYHLAKKVYKGGIQDFKSEDLELAKKSVGQVYGPLVIGQVSEWCDTDFLEAKKEIETEK